MRSRLGPALICLAFFAVWLEPALGSGKNRRPWYEIRRQPWEKQPYYFNSLAADSEVIASTDVCALASGPVTVAIKDPLGRITDRQKQEITKSRYLRMDFTTTPGDGILDQGVSVSLGAAEGLYQVSVMPDTEADPEARFVLEIFVKSVSVTLVDGLCIKDIPAVPWTVEVKNRPPDVMTYFGGVFQVGQRQQITLATRDYEHQKVTLRLKKYPDGMTLDPNTDVLSWKPTLDDLGDHEVIMVAEDEQGGVTEVKHTVVVRLPQPEITGARFRCTHAEVTWKPVEGAVGYIVYRTDLGALHPFHVGPTETVFRDDSIPFGTTVEYLVHAIDSTGGDSGQTKFATVRTGPDADGNRVSDECENP